jgi:hypothetical protein
MGCDYSVDVVSDDALPLLTAYYAVERNSLWRPPAAGPRLQFIIDVFFALDVMVRYYQSLVRDYAWWFDRYGPSATTYPLHVTRTACKLVTQCNLLGSQQTGWEWVGFPGTA